MRLRADFAPGAWELVDGSEELVCKTRARGRTLTGTRARTNKRCGRQLPCDDAFTLARSRRGDKVHGNSRVCDACIQRRDREVDAMTKRSLDHISKKPRAE